MSTQKNIRVLTRMLEQKGWKAKRVWSGTPGHCKVEVSDQYGRSIVVPIASSPKNDHTSVKEAVRTAERRFRELTA